VYPEPIWYYPEGGANILSLYNEKIIIGLQWIQVMMLPSMCTSTHNGKKIRLGSARKGVYIIDGDMNQCKKMCRELPTEALGEVFYDTLEQNKQRYPKRLYQRAARARNFQNRQYFWSQKGKTTRTMPKHVFDNIDPVP